MNQSRRSRDRVTNLDSLLADIYERYVRIREEDFALHYKVFDAIFRVLHQRMKDVDKYYEHYSSKVQFMGSHYDRLRIKKPDEFDMFNVIGLPPEVQKNLQIKPEEASFVFLHISENTIKLLKKSQNWEIDRQLLKWLSNNNNLQRSKFFNWFKGVVDKALIDIKGDFIVNGEKYHVKRSETGPAVTLVITNSARKFHMDVDLVPSFKFSTNLWPPGPNYRPIPRGSQTHDWLVVPKPDKYREECIRNVQWRIAMPEQERELMHDSYNLRQAIRLLKKLRDAQGMTKIASYFIKQLVFWEIDQGHDATFWTQSPATLFKLLVKKFYEAMKAKKIPYFWNKKNNLLKRIDADTLKVYENTLKRLITVLDSPDKYMKVANYLLTAEELKYYSR